MVWAVLASCPFVGVNDGSGYDRGLETPPAVRKRTGGGRRRWHAKEVLHHLHTASRELPVSQDPPLQELPDLDLRGAGAVRPGRDRRSPPAVQGAGPGRGREPAARREP